MYYQIEGTNVRLAGSMHFIPAGYGQLPAWVGDAYAWSQDLYLEGHPGELAFHAYDPAGTTLEQKLSAQTWQQLRDVWHLGHLRHERLWLILPTLARQSFAHVPGVEHYLTDRAQVDERVIQYLESAVEFAAIMNSVPDDIYIAQIERMVADLHGVRQMMADMYAAWISGRIHAVEAVLPRTPLGWDPTIKAAALNARNLLWLPKIIDALASDRHTLIIVGAAHLVGPSGLLSLLEERGRNNRQLA
jgi:uncharacterized protein YbaP (TraB family)